MFVWNLHDAFFIVILGLVVFIFALNWMINVILDWKAKVVTWIKKR